MPDEAPVIRAVLLFFGEVLTSELLLVRAYQRMWKMSLTVSAIGPSALHHAWTALSVSSRAGDGPLPNVGGGEISVTRCAGAP